MLCLFDSLPRSMSDEENRPDTSCRNRTRTRTPSASSSVGAATAAAAAAASAALSAGENIKNALNMASLKRPRAVKTELVEKSTAFPPEQKRMKKYDSDDMDSEVAKHTGDGGSEGDKMSQVEVHPPLNSSKIRLIKDLDALEANIEFRDKTSWAESYVRTRHKNLRCFPTCSVRHMENGFCGTSIFVYVSMANKDMVKEYQMIAIGALRKKESSFLFDTPCRDSLSNEVVIGEWRQWEPEHSRWLVEFVPPRRWKYNCKLAKHTMKQQHAFTAYLCVPGVSGLPSIESYEEQRDVMMDSDNIPRCVAVGESPPFRLTSAWKQPSSTSGSPLGLPASAFTRVRGGLEVDTNLPAPFLTGLPPSSSRTATSPLSFSSPSANASNSSLVLLQQLKSLEQVQQAQPQYLSPTPSVQTSPRGSSLQQLLGLNDPQATLEQVKQLLVSSGPAGSQGFNVTLAALQHEQRLRSISNLLLQQSLQRSSSDDLLRTSSLSAASSASATVPSHLSQAQLHALRSILDQSTQSTAMFSPRGSAMSGTVSGRSSPVLASFPNPSPLPRTASAGSQTSQTSQTSQSSHSAQSPSDASFELLKTLFQNRTRSQGGDSGM